MADRYQPEPTRSRPVNLMAQAARRRVVMEEATMNPTYWLIVGTPENYARTRDLGWRLAGVKSRHRKKAERMRPGDKIIFYLTRLKAFGSIVTITSTYREDPTPVWLSDKPGELYPYRVETEPDIIVEVDAALPAERVMPDLEYVRRWPAENWTLAFQGNVHLLNEHDYQELRRQLATRTLVGLRTE